MEGVNILYTEVEQVLTTKGELLMNIFITIFLIGIIMALICSIFNFIKISIIAGAIAVAVIVGGLIIPIDGTKVDQYIYKVTIDETANLKDFIDKYEVVSQEGNIYTIKEKIEGVSNYDSED